MFSSIFWFIIFTAVFDISLAYICLTPGTSRAYLIARKPVAANASNISKPDYKDKK